MTTPLLLAWKDLRVLVRTRALVLALIAYPLVIAAIVGSMLLQQGPPSIALVNEVRGDDTVRIADASFSVGDYIRRAERQGVDVHEMSRGDAERALDEGQVAGILVIPSSAVKDLQSQLSGARLEFHVGDNALGTIVAQRMRGVIYQINMRISTALIDANRSYLDALVDGGEVEVLGQAFDLYGLAPIEGDLQAARDELEAAGGDAELIERLDRAIAFADAAGSAIGMADEALETTAAPIRLDVHEVSGTSPLLTAQALSFALAVSIAFVCVVLVAASLAAERDEAVMGRLLHGIAAPWQVVVGKLLVGVVIALVFCSGLFAVFATLEPQAWRRLPLLLGAAVLASLACSAIGALLAVAMRDARTATLAGVLLVIPLAPLALVGTSGVLESAVGMLPVTPSRALFNAVLFDADPWPAVATNGARLVAIAIVPAGLAARFLRRLA